MTALTIAVVLVGALCVLDLLLTFGVIRRLREQSRTTNSRPGDGPPVLTAPVGTEVHVPDVPLEEETLVAFLSPSCGACADQLPDLIAEARGRERVVAVVFDPEGTGTELVDRLGEVARVLVERSTDDALLRAFRVTGYPAFCLVRAGVITATTIRVADLPKQLAGSGV